MLGEEQQDYVMIFNETDNGNYSRFTINKVSATDTTMDNATRVIGSVALNSSLTMDDSVKGYKLEWQIYLGVGLTYFQTTYQRLGGGPLP